MIKRTKRSTNKLQHSVVKNNESVNLSHKKQKEIINYILDASKPKLIPVIPLITLNELKRNKNQVSKKQLKITFRESYEMSDFNENEESSNEGDDDDGEEIQKKPVPYWATGACLENKLEIQFKSLFNFKNIFKSAFQNEIDLNDIF